jgi:TPR repeat protein
MLFFRARNADVLEQRVTALQAALRQCSEVAGRWSTFRGGITAAIAIAMLALGFALGTYREPVRESIVGLAQAVGVAKPASAFDTVQVAYQKGDYETVLRLGRPLADEGDVHAQSILGLVHYRGGRGISPDLGEAVRWFRQAADQGDDTAQFYLGVMYSEGRGVPQSYAEAAEWYRLAAERGNAPAQFNLAAARFPNADPRRSAAAAQRDLVAGRLTPDQRAAAQRWAREWKPKQ